MKNVKKIVLFSFMFLFVFAFTFGLTNKTEAAPTCTTTASGTWTNVAIWDCGHVPGTGEAGKVIGPYIVTVDEPVSVSAVIVDAGGTLNITGTNSITTGGLDMLAPADATASLLSVGSGSLYVTNSMLVLEMQR